MSFSSYPSRAAGLPRRAFLRYSGATALVGGLALAGCKKDDDRADPAPPAPTLARLAPDAGPVGTVVTLTGTGFTGTTRVTFGGVTAVSVAVVSDTTITATVPASAVSGPVQVTTPNGVATSPGAFTIQAVMAGTITGFTPTSGPAGTVVTISGNGFMGATAVAFGGVAAPNFTVNGDASITVTVPAGAVAGPITVTTPAGILASAAPFAILTTTLTNDDTGLLNYAYALEQLEAAFYTKVVTDAAALFTVAELDTLRAIRDHEIIHREFFKATLGANRLIDLTIDYTANGDAVLAVNFSSKASILNAARLFEDLGVQAYNGAVRYFQSVDYLALAGKIVSVEARHAALVRDMIAPNSFAAATPMGSVPPVANPSQRIELSKLPSQVLPLVRPFFQERAQLVSQLQ